MRHEKSNQLWLILKATNFFPSVSTIIGSYLHMKCNTLTTTTPGHCVVIHCVMHWNELVKVVQCLQLCSYCLYFMLSYVLLWCGSVVTKIEQHQ